MAISFVAKAEGTVNYTTSYSVSKPTGTANGDLLIAIVGGTRSGGVPSGWTQLGSAVDSGSTSLGDVNVYYQVANSEPSSYSFTVSSSLACAVILCYRGIDQTTPIDTSDFNIEADTGTNFNTTSLTAASNQWGLTFATGYEFGSSSTRTWSFGSGSERCDFSVANAGSPDNTNLAVADSNANLSAGSFSRTQTRSATCNFGVKGTILINEAVTGTSASAGSASAAATSDNPTVVVATTNAGCAEASAGANGITANIAPGAPVAVATAASNGPFVATGAPGGEISAAAQAFNVTSSVAGQPVPITASATGAGQALQAGIGVSADFAESTVDIDASHTFMGSPAFRTYKFEAESRTKIVDSESRTHQIAAETRIIAIGSD